ncbi:AAA family ATPase [Vibrio splendidus]|uniref:AAA family ATPase n=1 Tax=Vibrio splendidus TaxID=29497 RepID=UPI000C85DC51|nr:AAA family ATPase [Vibrio splendidus]PMH01691.1 hypothetical protein BCU75_09000 [Vibrio splendidus]
MKIMKLKLENYGRFSSLVLPLATSETVKSNVTVIVGNNGAGKTTILTSLATSLNWLVARLRREGGSTSSIYESAIKNGTSLSSITTYFKHDGLNSAQSQASLWASEDSEFQSWKLVKGREGKEKNEASELTQLTKLASIYRANYTKDDNASLPLIIYYPDDRTVADIDVDTPNKTEYTQFDAYTDGLLRGANFNDFFEWFRYQEDVENESLMSQSALDDLKKNVEESVYQQIVLAQESKKDPQLQTVRRAISVFMPEYTELHIKRKPRLHMSIKKHDEVLDVAQLSKGEKCMLALVGDIARRMAVLNPSLDNPLVGEGIVMIDEVDAHLHPKWQQTVLTNLEKTFPNLQFVVTTHSPQVLSTVKKDSIEIIDNGTRVPVIGDTYGVASSDILKEVMKVNPTPRIERVLKLEKYLEMVDLGTHTFDEGIALRAELEQDEFFGKEHAELQKADRKIRRKGLRSS